MRFPLTQACVLNPLDQRIFTDANLYDDDIHSQIHSDIDIIESFMCSHNIRRSPQDDLVLEMIRQDDGSIKTSYYFANHSKRCIYFLDEFKASELEAWGEVQGATSPTHISKPFINGNAFDPPVIPPSRA